MDNLTAVAEGFSPSSCVNDVQCCYPNSLQLAVLLKLLKPLMLPAPTTPTLLLSRLQTRVANTRVRGDRYLQASSQDCLTSLPKPMGDPVGLKSMVALVVQQCRAVCRARWITLPHGNHICQSGLFNFLAPSQNTAGTQGELV